MVGYYINGTSLFCLGVSGAKSPTEHWYIFSLYYLFKAFIYYYVPKWIPDTIRKDMKNSVDGPGTSPAKSVLWWLVTDLIELGMEQEI